MGNLPWDLPRSPSKAPRESPAWSGRTLRCGAFSEAELEKLTAPEAPADLVEARLENCPKLGCFTLPETPPFGRCW